MTRGWVDNENNNQSWDLKISNNIHEGSLIWVGVWSYVSTMVQTDAMQCTFWAAIHIDALLHQTRRMGRIIVTYTFLSCIPWGFWKNLFSPLFLPEKSWLKILNGQPNKENEVMLNLGMLQMSWTLPSTECAFILRSLCPYHHPKPQALTFFW